MMAMGAAGARGAPGYGYSLGVYNAGATNVIEKFAMASDGDGADVSNLFQSRYAGMGCTNVTTAHGYLLGGQLDATTYYDTIDKSLLASDGDATDVGNLTEVTTYGGASSSLTYGYKYGGTTYSGGAAHTNVIAKVSLTSDGDATDVGDLAITGTCNEVRSAADVVGGYGYAFGGYNPSASNIIERNSHSSDGNTSDVGDLYTARRFSAVHYDDTYAWAAGGDTGSYSDTSDRFAFGSSQNGAQQGDLTQVTGYGSGCSSNVDGYVVGNSANDTTRIEKITLASGGTYTDVASVLNGGGGNATWSYNP